MNFVEYINEAYTTYFKPQIGYIGVALTTVGLEIINRVREIWSTSAEFRFSLIDWAREIYLDVTYHWEYGLIPLITVIILGLVWVDSIIVNVTFLKPIQTTKNTIITQIRRIWTPEVKWIISGIICMFLYYFYINRETLELVPMQYIVSQYLSLGFLLVGLRIVLQWFGNPSTEDLFITVLSKLFISPVQKFLQTMFACVEIIFSKVLPGKTLPLKGIAINSSLSLTMLVCIYGTNYTDQYCAVSPI